MTDLSDEPAVVRAVRAGCIVVVVIASGSVSVIMLALAWGAVRWALR